MIKKVCSKCKKEKSIDSFYKYKLSKDGYFCYCKQCCKEYGKINYSKNREYLLQKQREYSQEYNRKQYVRKYNQLPEIQQRRKKWNIQNYQDNRQKYIDRGKKWQKDNKEKVRIYNKEWKAKEKRQNSQFKLNCLMTNLIGVSLKGNKNNRHWEDLVGYSLQELKVHLENLFDKKMSWKNQGSYWHIDHIKPKSLFSFIEPEDKEFKECWALDNLQPLEGIENIRKGNKYFK